MCGSFQMRFSSVFVLPIPANTHCLIRPALRPQEMQLASGSLGLSSHTRRGNQDNTVSRTKSFCSFCGVLKMPEVYASWHFLYKVIGRELFLFTIVRFALIEAL